MPYAVLSDIHSNLHALTSVLRDIERHSIDEIYCAGDVVGYGPRPGSCIEIIKEGCRFTVAGNHDWAVIGYTDITYFNQYARDAVLWTQHALSDEHLKDLEEMSLVKSSQERDALLVHASPKDPEQWNYILSHSDAEISFRFFKQSLCFVGHSHIPAIIEKPDSGEILVHGRRVEIRPQSRYIVNVGSVGQPRDHNAQASYAIVGEDSIEIIRVDYDIQKTQEEMVKAGLPSRLIERLSHGV